MLKLDNVTLISMSSIDLTGTIRAMRQSMEGVTYGDVKLITHEDIELSDIKTCKIDQINGLDEYSYNMIYKLEHYVETDFVLVVQADGYVLNPEMWQDCFLDYDYIGAPFPMPNDNFTFRNSEGELFRVGNGGFSLRSRKLIKLANQLELEWKAFHGFYNEDGFISVNNRRIYEKAGCRFAPVDVAKYFSHESEIPEIQNIKPFGFHGKRSKYL